MQPDAAVAAFEAAWNADDAGRLALLSRCCLAEAEFVAPGGVTRGTVAVSASIGEFRRSFPAAVVALGATEACSRCGRVSWATRWNDGREAPAGEDFIEFADDGRIRRIVSSNGSPAAA